MKVLLTGNEAIARGVYEAGVRYASAYPGTPSTEVLENISGYKEMISEWAPNEKVAVEAAAGAQTAGARSFAAMKHVGLNVAADPLFTLAYVGVTAGMVIVTADEPGQFSSQNEQDNRNYAKAAKVPIFEPADSQEAKDMLKAAYEISEQYDVPVLLRPTTRVCHSKGLVELEDRVEKPLVPYQKDIERRMAVPAYARKMKIKLQGNMKKLEEYSNHGPWNRLEDNQQDIGIIASGDCYLYAREVFGDDASYLKIGFSNPLPEQLIRDFASRVNKLYIIEENDPYMEEFVRRLGIDCHGKDVLPENGEMLPEVIREAILGQKLVEDEEIKSAIIRRPPTLCAGCPHRGFFYELGKQKNVIVSGDIGCYSLTFARPYNSIDFNLCMGASLSMGHGAKKVLAAENSPQRVVSVIGDSTFFHTGINSLIHAVYNGSSTVNVIMDNRITAMTGQQENPGSGLSAQGEIAHIIDIESVVRALGVKNIRVINPIDLKQVKETIEWALGLDELSVIITRWPCALKKQTEADRLEFQGAFQDVYTVEQEVCIGCKKCTKTGCPAIVFQTEKKKSSIDASKCVGCSVCAQVCPVQAIQKVVRA